jgi:hypothetical protein
MSTNGFLAVEAVLRTVMATLFTDDFFADLTADVNKRLAWIARQPIPSTKKLEQEIANEDRQLKRRPPGHTPADSQPPQA